MCPNDWARTKKMQLTEDKAKISASFKLSAKGCKNCARMIRQEQRKGNSQTTLLNISASIHLLSYLLKGTVSRDFLLLVFFMNQFLPSPRVLH